jgi:carboxymethylenebutenolidase
VINPKLHRYVKDLTPEKSYLVGEFVENYEDGFMRRRDLLERVYRITGSVAAAAGTLLAMGVKPAFADPLARAEFRPQSQTPPSSPLTVPANDPAVIAGPVTFPSGNATIMAYWARPAAAGRYPAVLICHENRGTGPHYEDVTRRFAKAGYAAIIVDLLSRQGGTAAVPPNEAGAILSAPGAREQHVGDFRAAVVFMRRQSFVIPDRIGMTGYCFGGGITYLVVAAEPTLRAAVPFYGPVMDASGLRNARAAVLGVYGANDAGVNASIPAVEEALRAAGVTFRTMQYAGAGHAFFNDTNPNSYNEAAALAAWRDTLAWFGMHLVAGASLLPGTGDGTRPDDDAVETPEE